MEQFHSDVGTMESDALFGLYDLSILIIFVKQIAPQYFRCYRVHLVILDVKLRQTIENYRQTFDFHIWRSLYCFLKQYFQNVIVEVFEMTIGLQTICNINFI